MDILYTVCLCVLVRLRISPLRMKLAASNFARRFIGVQGWESDILCTLLYQKPKIRQSGQRAGPAQPSINIAVEMRRCKRHARDALFVKFNHVPYISRRVDVG